MPNRKKRKRKAPDYPVPDPRPATQIMAEEVLLTKPMLAKVFGYRAVRSVEILIQDDCASKDPCLRPVYLRVPHKRLGTSGALFPEDFPSLKSLRFRREDVIRYIEKMQIDFPADLEWKAGGNP